MFDFNWICGVRLPIKTEKLSKVWYIYTWGYWMAASVSM